MKENDVVASLGALAQETRLAIFRRLVRAGPKGEAAGAIGEALKIAAPTLSFHLKGLERAGLIGARRESRNIFYAVDCGRMREVLDYLVSDCCANDPQICCLPAAIKEPSHEAVSRPRQRARS